MVSPRTVVQSVKTAIKESGRLPSSVTYSVYELDTEGAQSDVRPPIVELQIIDVPRSRPHNTDLAGYTTDGSGNHTGRIYHVKFEMTIQIDVWTAEGSSDDPYTIGTSLRQALYPYDVQVRANPLPDPDNPSQDVSDVSYFSVRDGSVENDLSLTPALRRWRTQAEVWFHETVTTSADPVTEVVTPSPGDYEGDPQSDGDVLIEYDATPNEQSAADTN